MVPYFISRQIARSAELAPPMRAATRLLGSLVARTWSLGACIASNPEVKVTPRAEAPVLRSQYRGTYVCDGASFDLVVSRTSFDHWGDQGARPC